MPHTLLSFTNDVIDVIHLVHLFNWVLVILDNFTIKSLHRNENFHQNYIDFIKFIANVREKLRVYKKFLVSKKKFQLSETKIFS